LIDQLTDYMGVRDKDHDEMRWPRIEAGSFLPEAGLKVGAIKTRFRRIHDVNREGASSEVKTFGLLLGKNVLRQVLGTCPVQSMLPLML
jgi:hypothetical protein